MSLQASGAECAYMFERFIDDHKWAAVNAACATHFGFRITNRNRRAMVDIIARILPPIAVWKDDDAGISATILLGSWEKTLTVPR